MTTNRSRAWKLIPIAARMVPVLALIGCGAVAPRGAVLMKIDDRTLHVRLQDADLRLGDRIALYDSRCESRSTLQKPHRTVCRTDPAGTATVVDAFNDRDFVVQVDPGTTGREGQLVGRSDER